MWMKPLAGGSRWGAGLPVDPVTEDCGNVQSWSMPNELWQRLAGAIKGKKGAGELELRDRAWNWDGKLLLPKTSPQKGKLHGAAQSGFTCRDGQVIPSFSRCDAHKDCNDGSDESFVECFKEICQEYKCSYGGCYQETQRCDGKLDCWDGTDETPSLCNKNQTQMTAEEKVSTPKCPENSLKCQSTSDCVDYKYICDGIKDCQDGSDETIANCLISECPNNTFRCAYGGCLAINKACDGEIDCWDKSDEEYAICANNFRKLAPATLTEARNGTNRTTPMVSTNLFDVIRMVVQQSTGCRIPGNLKHLQVKTLFNVLPYRVGSEIADFTVVRLSCSNSTLLLGSDLNLCRNGKWQGPWPDCVSRCRRGIFTRNPSIRSACHYNGDTRDCTDNSSKLFIGTLANVTCATGYKSKGKTSWQTRTCVELPRATAPVWILGKKQNRLQCVPECGIIVPGVKDTPWTVSLFTNALTTSKFSFRCLGKIISAFSVLVEKQCIDTVDVMRYAIISGEYLVAFNDFDESPYKVHFLESIYKGSQNALVSTVDPFIFSTLLRPICLPPIPEWYAQSSSTTAYTTSNGIKITYLISIEDDIREKIKLIRESNSQRGN
ncbi:modular serine protease [Drosophila erecta]|uniref:GG14074 n=1 Tax=Drosophila erecta TaxID=7220 RepID=B3P2X2_DROER|nr:modular serine protease [Drosophila erecta]